MTNPINSKTDGSRRPRRPGLVIAIAVAVGAQVLAVVAILGAALFQMPSSSGVIAELTPIPSLSPSPSQDGPPLIESGTQPLLELTAVPTSPANSPTASPTPPPTIVPPGQTLAVTQPVQTATATRTTSATPSATATATATGRPTATATATPSGPWTFSGVKVAPDQATGNLLLYGEAINVSGATRQLTGITGTFYGPQGQIIAGPLDTLGRWPTNLVPPGGRLPFELTAIGIDSAASYTLAIQSQPASALVRQDFEFIGITSTNLRERVCLGGEVRNPGPPLTEYLVVAAVLFDGDGNVLNLSDALRIDPIDLAGGRAVQLTLCASPYGQAVAGQELRAWGR